MNLNTLEEALKEIVDNFDELGFAEGIHRAREVIGMKLAAAADFVGVTPNRLKNLESEMFRQMPCKGELLGISHLYGIPYKNLEEKAKSFVMSRKRKGVLDA